jgi:hypothetical protein
MLPLPFAASVGTGWRLVVDLGLELNGEVREAGSAAEERVTRRGVTGCDIARASAVVGVGAVAVGTLVRRDQEWRAVVGVFGIFGREDAARVSSGLSSIGHFWTVCTLQ